MKLTQKLILIAAVLILCLGVLPSPASAQDPTPPAPVTINGDKVVLGSSYTLRTNETLAGNLAVLGGTAVVQEGAVVAGDVIILGGSISLDGEVTGNVVAIGGVLSLGDSAHVIGAVNNLGGTVNKSDSARIDGGINTQLPQNIEINPTIPADPADPLGSLQDGLVSVLWAGLQALALSALAVVFALLLPEPIRRVAQTLTLEPVISGGAGLLTVVAAPALLVALVITVILIPVALLGVFALALAGIFAWIALGYELGERMAQWFKMQWAAPISAGVGTLVLTLVVRLIGIIPCVGWMVGFLLLIWALGAVILSRFGTQIYTNRPAAPAAVVRAPASVPTASTADDTSVEQ